MRHMAAAQFKPQKQASQQQTGTTMSCTTINKLHQCSIVHLKAHKHCAQCTAKFIPHGSCRKCWALKGHELQQLSPTMIPMFWRILVPQQRKAPRFDTAYIMSTYTYMLHLYPSDSRSSCQSFTDMVRTRTHTAGPPCRCCSGIWRLSSSQTKNGTAAWYAITNNTYAKLRSNARHATRHTSVQGADSMITQQLWNRPSGPLLLSHTSTHIHLNLPLLLAPAACHWPCASALNTTPATAHVWHLTFGNKGLQHTPPKPPAAPKA